MQQPIQIAYNPITPGLIYVNNATGLLKPYRIDGIIPIWNVADQKLELRYSHNDHIPILSSTGYADISLSYDGGNTFFNAPNFDDLLGFVVAIGAEARVVTASLTPVITAGAPYVDSTVIGGVMDLNLLRMPNSSGTLQAIIVSDKAQQESDMIIFIFAAYPRGTYTDNTAPVNAHLDAGNIICCFDLASRQVGTPYFEIGDVSVSNMTINKIVQGADDSIALYAVAIINGAPTYVNPDDLTFTFIFKQD